MRLIHDCSRPFGNSVNDYALPSAIHYESIDTAYKLATQGKFMCKIDLKAAYRSVAIHPVDYHLAGLQFQFSGDQFISKLFDVRLPFGSSKGPMIFNRLSQAVKRMMYRRGYENLVVYLDDFLIVEDSYERCVEAQQVLLSLLIKLGFRISWTKVTSCKQKVEFLGICIDTSTCSASLSTGKVMKLYNLLQEFVSRKRASKRQLQSLAGSLNWACQVIRVGRFFLRRILDTMNKLKEASHKCKLNEEFRSDLHWWLKYLETFNMTLYYRDVQKLAMHTDACNEGGGMFLGGKWYYVNWKKDLPKASKLHINYKEVLAAVLGIIHWAPFMINCDITIITDSTVAKGILNKGSCRHSYVMGWLRKMFWILENYNVRIKAIHIPGCLNQIPDAISRLHESGQGLRLHALMKQWRHGYYFDTFYNECQSSMSDSAFQALSTQLNKWLYRLN